MTSAQLRSPHTCVCIGTSAPLMSDLERLAHIAGVDLTVIAPTDDPPPSVLTLTETSPTQVSASFDVAYHPGLAGQHVRVHPREQPGDILELFVAAGATRQGHVIGVVSLHGGAGGTLTSLLLARNLAQASPVALVDADPLSRAIPIFTGIDAQGKRWADILLEHGTLLPGRLLESLPTWHGVHLVTGDDRGGAPGSSDALRIATSLSQVSSQLVIDLPRTCLTSPGGWFRLIDHLVAVTGPSLPSLATAKALLESLPQIDRTVVVSGPPTVGAALDCGEQMGQEVLALRRDRRLMADVAHHVSPGDRLSGRAKRDLEKLAARVSP